MTQETDDLRTAIEQETNKRFVDLVRTRYWASFATVAVLAEDMGYTKEELLDLMRGHPWELQPPTALRYQNNDMPTPAISEAATVADFVSHGERGAAGLGTKAIIEPNGEEVRITIECRESDMASLTQSAGTTEKEKDAFNLGVWEAHFGEWEGEWQWWTRQHRHAGTAGTLDDLLKRARSVGPRPYSVFEDDCVIVALTPVCIGNDTNYLDVTRFDPDPWALARELKRPADSRIYQTGTYYLLAVNPRGVVQETYYDPWEDGFFWPSWRSGGEFNAEQSDGSWRVTMTIPFRNLEPLMDNGAIWGVDIFRHKPATDRFDGEHARSRETTFFQYEGESLALKHWNITFEDTIRHAWCPAVGAHVLETTERTAPETTAARLGSDVLDGEWPADSDWGRAERLSEFFDDRTGDAARARTDVQLLFDKTHLFVRCQCHELHTDQLQVVTSDDEKAEYPGHLRANFLHRRCTFGIGWGDFVEIMLVPGVNGADRYHGGFYDLLVNSRGTLLESRHDSFAMVSLRQEDEWHSGSRVSVDVQDDMWTVRIAIPFESLCGLRSDDDVWHLNLQRMRAAKPDDDWRELSAWAPSYGWPRNREYGGKRNPERFGRLVAPGGNLGPCVARAWMDSCSGDSRAYWSTCGERWDGWPPRAGNPKGGIFQDGFATEKQVWHSKQKAGQPFGRVPGCDHPPGRSTPIFTSPYDRPGRCSSTIHPRMGPNSRRVPLELPGADFATCGTGDNEAAAFMGRTDEATSEPRTRDRGRDPLRSVCSAGKQDAWAVGGLGTILRTQNGSATWEEQASGTGYALESVTFANHEHGWAVGGWLRDKSVATTGGMGIVLATTDGGRHWREQWKDKGPWLYDVCFVDELVGWAAGENGNVLKTEDAGATWQHLPTTNTIEPLLGVCFTDRQHGCAGGGNETIIGTRDGGRSWTRARLPVLPRQVGMRSSFNAVCAVGLRHCWVAGTQGTVLRTTNGGETWERQDLGIAPQAASVFDLNDVCFTDESNGWVVGEIGSVIFRTEDGGDTWESVRTGISHALSGIHFVDACVGWAVGERGTRLKTMDGGRSWQVEAAAPERPGLMYIAAHDHHINGLAGVLAALAADREITCIFGLGKPDVCRAAAWCLGAWQARIWRRYIGGRRRAPGRLHHHYQIKQGLEPLERQLTATIRALKPESIISEWPIMDEGYWAGEPAFVARAMARAFESAADPNRFPELAELGLHPWQPSRLYHVAGFFNDLYGVHPTNVTLKPDDKYVETLGMHATEAAFRHSCCWRGLLDRHSGRRTVGTLNLHLKREVERKQRPHDEDTR